MIINVASFGGRSHLLDLARELEKQGNTVRFYSYVPTKRALAFGLKKECSYSILWFSLPFLVLFRLFGHGKWREDIYNYCCDWFLAYYMKPCDVFIGQSPMHIQSIKRMKKKYNALTILERGISHVSFQSKVLDEISQYSHAMSKYHIKRDMEGYKYPDYISVGSNHVKETFTNNGYPEHKIFVNNYGFNATFFKPTTLSQDKVYDILFVGQWCKRKGSDLLIRAAIDLNKTVLHVGTIRDLPFPQNRLFYHVDSVPEYELYKYYSQSRIFVIPSRDEGLALVQPQALACGLPLVCSQYSGGRDLKKYIGDNTEYIFEMESYNIECLKICIEQALNIAEKQVGTRVILKDTTELSFFRYGQRYNEFLLSIVHANGELS